MTMTNHIDEGEDGKNRSKDRNQNKTEVRTSIMNK